jgi:fermentation-respiration switch protein FrsA (DUF1100 family)
MVWTRRLLILFLLLQVAGGVFLCEATLHPAHIRPNHQKLGNSETVSVQAFDGVHLDGWYLRNPEPKQDRTIILLHGVSDNRYGMRNYASVFLRHGYHILMPDARDHGTSGGKLSTYGLLEKKDVNTWLQWLQNQKRASCVVALGESMGAAMILQSAGDPGLRAIVA